MLTPEEHDAESESCFWKGEKKSITYEKFGGLSYFDYVDKLEDEIIRHNPPEVYESFSTVFSYRRGIGLNIVISADEINRFTIEEAIRRFQELGEKNWRSASPVPGDRLPKSASELPLISCHSALESALPFAP